MITRNDCILLLSDIEDKGIDTKDMLNLCIKSNKPNIDVIKFINKYQPMDLITFYNKIRKSYNNKKSTVYINIMKEIDNVDEVMVTLSSLLTQIMLFSKTVNDKQMFLSHSRADEISKVVNIYVKSYDPSYAIKLLQLIKADIKVLESL